MSSSVHVGSILMGDGSPQVRQILSLRTEPYLRQWSMLIAENGFSLERKAQQICWTFFYLADELKTVFLGASTDAKVRSALTRILRKLEHQSFNCLEVTGIDPKWLCGVPYVTVSAHARHLQRGFQLDGFKRRRADHHDAEWARG